MGKCLRDDVAGAIGELQRPAAESGRPVRVAGEVRVLRGVGHDGGKVERGALPASSTRSQISSARSKCWTASA